MDAFYASVEQRDHPALRGKPVIVGGDPSARGVVAACSYEARRYGIHSAMPSRRAYERCPRAIFVKPRFQAYQTVSAQIRKIFHEYTHLVEPLSLDEAYLDVTENKKGMRSATLIAQEIRKKINQNTGLTASAGVSFNKFLAKIASDCNKPDGITVITPEQADEFISRLPIGKFFGIGKVTETRMMALGIHTGADLKQMEKEELVRLFGKAGSIYYDFARSVDLRPVNPHRIRKSIGKETTLLEDISDRDRMIHILERLAEQIEALLKQKTLMGRTITLKVKYFDFKTITRRITVSDPVRESTEIMEHVVDLLDRTDAGGKKVRLLGIVISNFKETENKHVGIRQLPLPF